LRKIKTGKFKPFVQAKTPVIDPYFSATKLLWLKEIEKQYRAIENGCFF
jgi:glycerol kinase